MNNCDNCANKGNHNVCDHCVGTYKDGVLVNGPSRWEQAAIVPVLCKNCTYHDTNACPENRVWCKRLSRYMNPDGYCSYGKGKDQ